MRGMVASRYGHTPGTRSAGGGPVSDKTLELISEMTQEDESTGEVEKAQEVLRSALVADNEPTEAVRLGEEALHLPAPAVAPQFSAVLSLAAAAAVRSNERYASLLPESLVQPVAVMGLVPDEPFGQLVLRYAAPIGCRSRGREVRRRPSWPVRPLGRSGGQ